LGSNLTSKLRNNRKPDIVGSGGSGASNVAFDVERIEAARRAVMGSVTEALRGQRERDRAADAAMQGACQETLSALNQAEVDARMRRSKERAQRAAQMEADSAAFQDLEQRWKEESKQREDEMLRRHAEERRRSEEEKAERDKRYAEMMEESRQRAAAAEDFRKRRQDEMAEARQKREDAYAQVRAEEERVRNLRAQAHEREDDELRREEEAARAAFQQAQDDLLNARQRESRVNAGMAGGFSNIFEPFNKELDGTEARWAKFERIAASEAYIVTFEDVPYVTRDQLYRDYPMYADRQKVYKTLCKRWHPDKFLQRFCGNIAKKEDEQIMAAVKESFQVVHDMCQK